LAFSARRLIALFALISLLLALRFPEPLFRPWTFVNEEGTVFFQDAYNLGFWEAVFTPYAGYCTVAGRLLAAGCLWLPYRTLPFVYSFLSLLVAAAVFCFFYLPYFRRVVASDWRRFAVCLGLCAAPAYPLLRLEMIHFYLAIWLALVVIMELPPSGAGKAGLAAAAGVAIWSAPSAMVYLPLFLFRIVRRGISRAERAVWLLIAAISVGYLAHVWAGRQSRAEQIDAGHLFTTAWHAVAYRVVAVGLIGEKWADRLVSSFGWNAVLPLLLLVIALAALVLNMERRRGRPLFPLVALLWAIVATAALIVLRPDFSVTYVRFDPKYPYWPNDRYFFPAAALLVLFFGAWLRLRGGTGKALAILGACWCCSMCMWGYAFHPWNAWGPKFLPYSKQLEAAEREAVADGKIHKLIIPIASKSWLMTLEAGKKKHAYAAHQEIAPSTQKLTDFFDLDEDRPGLRHSTWFGAFDDAQYPWLQHKTYGWMVCLGTATGGFWFWSKDLDAFWTAPWEFPRVYLSKTNNWITLKPQPFAPSGR
jgi:hypothetical protein